MLCAFYIREALPQSGGLSRLCEPCRPGSGRHRTFMYFRLGTDRRRRTHAGISGNGHTVLSDRIKYLDTDPRSPVNIARSAFALVSLLQVWKPPMATQCAERSNQPQPATSSSGGIADSGVYVWRTCGAWAAWDLRRYRLIHSSIYFIVRKRVGSILCLAGQ